MTTATQPVSFEQLTLQRHSSRSYDPNRSVSASQILAMSKAAHNAPSCYNDQPWAFIFCNRATHPEAYKKAFDTLVEFNQGWAKDAPLLVIVVADSQFKKNHKDNRWGQYDTGAAAISMTLEAASLGLMAHQMGGFDEKKIQSDFQIPSRYVPMAVIAIGYESANQPVTPKERAPLAQSFFEGSWGNGIK